MEYWVIKKGLNMRTIWSEPSDSEDEAWSSHCSIYRPDGVEPDYYITKKKASGYRAVRVRVEEVKE